jgi:uncharacterized protein involved in exopolysaccharide biosynthesis
MELVENTETSLPDTASTEGVSVRDFLALARRRLPLLLAFVLLALVLSVVTVRLWPLGYEARATLIENETLGSSGLSLLPSIGGLLQGSGAAGELEAVLKSRRLAVALATDRSLAATTSRLFPERPQTLFDEVKSSAWTSILRLPPPVEPELATRIEASLDRAVQVVQNGKIINITYVGADRQAAGSFLSAALEISQKIVVERQRVQAFEYEKYLISALSNDKQQESVRVINQLLPGVISTVTRLSSPNAEAYGIVDDVYVNPDPVQPRVLLVIAVFVALGLVSYCVCVIAIVVRRK